jgi:uncharacterized protein (TIGR00251 family)
MDELRVRIRVRPGASRVAVGGRHGPDELVVAVRERAVEGAANRAVVAALAAAFGVGRSDVVILHGRRARSKAVAVAGDREVLAKRLAELLGG